MSFLSDILERKRLEVAERKAAVPEAELASRVQGARHARSLFNALSPPGGPTRVIAELKRASPSAGVLRGDLDPVAVGRTYAQAGAAALSVLTDGPGFGGSLEDLRQVRPQVTVPLLRKDFIVDRYQLLEARVAGADAVLLIVAALSSDELVGLHQSATALGLEVLVEVHDDDELVRALGVGARLVGVNNRDLRTFQVDLGTCERLLPRIPREVRGVAESGVKGVAEVQRLRRAGAANFLVGEALTRAASPEGLLRELGET
jgi:indole-3-glycerol phosphate synthase